MGLLWSMKQAPGQRKGIKLMKSDVTKPYNIVLNCFDDHVTPRPFVERDISEVLHGGGSEKNPGARR